MRFPSFLFPVALLLCTSSISAESLAFGTWTNPTVNYDLNPLCCIPTSVRVDCPENSQCSAFYEYPESTSSKCYAMFQNSKRGQIDVFRSTASDASWNSKLTRDGINWYLEARNRTGNPQLIVYCAADMGTKACNFTMTTRKALAVIPSASGFESTDNSSSSSSSNSGLYLVLFIALIIIVAIKLRHRSQDNIAKAQSLALAQLPTQLVPNLKFRPPPPVQQFVQPQPQPQPQSTYTAPNQFVPPKIQVDSAENTTSSEGNGAPGQFLLPRIQVNMNSGGSGQYPNTQINANHTRNSGIAHRSGII